MSSLHGSLVCCCEELLYWIKAGPAGGRRRRPPAVGSTTATGSVTVLTARTRHAAKRAGIGTPGAQRRSSIQES